MFSEHKSVQEFGLSALTGALSLRFSRSRDALDLRTSFLSDTPDTWTPIFSIFQFKGKKKGRRRTRRQPAGVRPVSAKAQDPDLPRISLADSFTTLIIGS